MTWTRRSTVPRVAARLRHLAEDRGRPRRAAPRSGAGRAASERRADLRVAQVERRRHLLAPVRCRARTVRTSSLARARAVGGQLDHRLAPGPRGRPGGQRGVGLRVVERRPGRTRSCARRPSGGRSRPRTAARPPALPSSGADIPTDASARSPSACQRSSGGWRSIAPGSGPSTSARKRRAAPRSGNSQLRALRRTIAIVPLTPTSSWIGVPVHPRRPSRRAAAPLRPGDDRATVRPDRDGPAVVLAYAEEGDVDGGVSVPSARSLVTHGARPAAAASASRQTSPPTMHDPPSVPPRRPARRRPAWRSRPRARARPPPRAARPRTPALAWPVMGSHASS